MSRIQNIREKAEREGAALGTSRLGAPAAPTRGPVTREIPAAQAPDAPVVIAPGANMSAAATPSLTAPPSMALGPNDGLERVTVRLNPLLVAGLAPQSLAAEQFRALRTRLSHAEPAGRLRT